MRRESATVPRLYGPSKGQRFSPDLEEGIARVRQMEGGKSRAEVVRLLLMLGLSSYKVDPQAAGLLDGVLGRLLVVAEMMEANNFPIEFIE
jgi:hypothetical protein